MKIAVIYTGGTIGSSDGRDGIAPEKSGADRLLDSARAVRMTGELIHILPSQALSDARTQEIQFISHHPFTLLSENSTGLVLAGLADCIREALLQPDLDGIVVTHGTDTLAYSAAAMGYLFADSPLPIVFVSSNYVLQDKRANGWDNFKYAVAFMAQAKQHRERKTKGVFVSYRNASDVPRIHRGTALLPYQAYSDRVYSVCGSEYGHFEQDGDGCRFVYRDCDAECGEHGDKMQQTPILRAPTSWNAPILQIYPCTGMEYPDIPDNTRAILHHTYHAGTICSETPNAKAFFAEAAGRGIPLFVCGVEPSMYYQSMEVYERQGLHVLPVASPVAMYIKLWLLIEGNEDVLVWMMRRIAGDVIDL